MDPYMLPFNLRDAVLCLTFLLGVVAGIFALTRNQKKVGAFVIAGFLLLGIDPVAEFVLFSVLTRALGLSDYQGINWAYACISGIADVLGVFALLAAIYFALTPGAKDAEPPVEEVVFAPKE